MSKATAATQFYDPVINSWELGPPLPEPMHHAMLVNYHDQLAVIGGFRSSDTDPLAVTSPRMLLLDNNTDKWVDGPPLRHPRAAGGAAVVGDEIVVVGGRVGNPAQLVTQTEVYDGTGWRDAANIPTPGDHLAVTADSKYLYAVGGRKFSAGSNTDVVQRYDPKADRWTALPRTPQTVSGAGAAIVDGQLVIVGREDVHQRLRHRPGLRPDRPQRHLEHLALPRPGPPWPRCHRHRQHPLRRRRRHQSRTHRIHQPRRSTDRTGKTCPCGRGMVAAAGDAGGGAADQRHRARRADLDGRRADSHRARQPHRRSSTTPSSTAGNWVLHCPSRCTTRCW